LERSNNDDGDDGDDSPRSVQWSRLTFAFVEQLWVR